MAPLPRPVVGGCVVDEQVSARQQGVFPPGLLLREDLDGGALLVQPARDVGQVVEAGGSVRGLDLTPAFNSKIG